MITVRRLQSPSATHPTRTAACKQRKGVRRKVGRRVRRISQDRTFDGENAKRLVQHDDEQSGEGSCGNSAEALTLRAREAAQ
jgi:hypothetical protein